MKWMIAALVFASVVGLAVATAAIQAENVRSRTRIEEWTEQLRALRVELWAERVLWTDATRLEALVELWLRIREHAELRQS